MRNIDNEIQLFVKLIQKHAGFANPEITVNEAEVTVKTVHAEDGRYAHHTALVTWIGDEYIDITRSNDAGDIIWHQIITREDVDAEGIEVPFAVIDVNTCFSGDADCGVIAALHNAIDCPNLWEKTKDITVSLKDKLDRFIEDVKDPSVFLSPEEMGHGIARIIIDHLEEDDDWDVE